MTQAPDWFRTNNPQIQNATSVLKMLRVIICCVKRIVFDCRYFGQGGATIITCVHYTGWVITKCNELGDSGVGWNLSRPTTAIRFSKEHRHNPVMV